MGRVEIKHTGNDGRGSGIRRDSTSRLRVGEHSNEGGQGIRCGGRRAGIQTQEEVAQTLLLGHHLL